MVVVSPVTVSGSAVVTTEVGTFISPVEVVTSKVEDPGVIWAKPVALMATVIRPDRVWEYLILEE
jgi:hypothetical protein